MTMMMLMMMLKEGFSQKENGNKGVTNHIFWTQGLKVKRGQKTLGLLKRRSQEHP